MIGFLLRKNFYDLWDNLFRVALLNIGFIASAGVFIALAYAFSAAPVLSMASLAVGALWCGVYLAASALALRKISDYGIFGFAEFFAALKEAWPAGLVFGAAVVVGSLLSAVVFPFYFALGNLLGLFAAALVFWTMAVAVLALQYYLPIRARLDTDIRKIVKKCFIVFFDNPLFSLFLAVNNAIAFAISIMLAFLLPGPAGILLFLDEALRLRLLKYDYLEAHPDADRRKIPWEELIVSDRETTGTRSLKSFIFPWKD